MKRSLILVSLIGCSFTPPTPIAYVRKGPAYGQLVTPLAAMPVECARTTMGCQPGYKVAVAAATRMAIEFGGYSLVDSELINVELQRRQTHTENDSTTTELTGRTWLDLPEQQRRDLLMAMGIRGIVTTTIAMGIPQGMAGQRTVTVAIAVSRLADDKLVWQSQCGVETGDFHSEPQAIDLATRCALESGSLW
ncbi:MAG: hypothetical protein ABI867_27795 [Kofleriaceae bacterium]